MTDAMTDPTADGLLMDATAIVALRDRAAAAEARASAAEAKLSVADEDITKLYVAIDSLREELKQVKAQLAQKKTTATVATQTLTCDEEQLSESESDPPDLPPLETQPPMPQEQPQEEEQEQPVEDMHPTKKRRYRELSKQHYGKANVLDKECRRQKLGPLIEQILHKPIFHLKNDWKGEDNRLGLFDEKGAPIHPQLLHKKNTKPAEKFEMKILCYADRFTEEMQKLDAAVNLPPDEIQYIPVYRHTQIMDGMICPKPDNWQKIEASKILSIAFDLLPHVAGELGLPVLQIEKRFDEERTLTCVEPISFKGLKSWRTPPIVLIPKLYVMLINGEHPMSEKVKELLSFSNLFHCYQIKKREEQLNRQLDDFQKNYIKLNVPKEDAPTVVSFLKFLGM